MVSTRDVSCRDGRVFEYDFVSFYHTMITYYTSTFILNEQEFLLKIPSKWEQRAIGPCAPTGGNALLYQGKLYYFTLR